MKRDDLFAGYEQGQRDMLAKCIAAVEALDVCWYVDDACQSQNHGILHDVSRSLRALQEVDTPQQELNEHINLDKP